MASFDSLKFSDRGLYVDVWAVAEVAVAVHSNNTDKTELDTEDVGETIDSSPHHYYFCSSLNHLTLIK